MIRGFFEMRGAKLVAAMLVALLISLMLVLGLGRVALAATDYDGDGATDNDCEPLDPAVHPGATDHPDLTFEDLNCDGIDGDRDGAYFVMPAGSDGNVGTANAPFQTIQRAIDAARASTSTKAIYVATGTYNQRLSLPADADGIRIYGGYEAGTWGRTTSTTTVVNGQPDAMVLDGARDVVVQLVTLNGTRGAGLSAYGLRAINNSELALIRAAATAGAGGAGGTGAIGSQPGKAAAGANGSMPPNCDTPGAGGSGAFQSGNGTDGGAGGTGGQETNDGENGQAGAKGGGFFGGAGGAGGVDQDGDPNPPDWEGMTGKPGQTGATGAAGSNGSGGGNDFGAAGTSWAGRAGTGGANGAAGYGGGGGGGGAGRGAWDAWQAGAGGGQGGDGGAGGTRGFGGGAGGGVRTDCRKTSGAGGAGGKGGSGGAGGDGGGGSGGPSAALMRVGTAAATDRDSTLSHGTGGDGGRGGGVAGQSGQQLPAASTSATDFDGDGIADSSDACVEIPRGTDSNGDGCPDRPAKLSDTDGDGVPDNLDACPTVAADTANGCPPGARINDVRVMERTTNARFIVRLSATSQQSITLNYATANGTAKAPADYATRRGTLTFSPGQTTKRISVPIRGDRRNERNEVFFVRLSGATNATIADGSGRGTIIDND